MSIKKSYILHQAANHWIVLPLTEETVNHNGTIMLNDCATILRKELKWLQQRGPGPCSDPVIPRVQRAGQDPCPFSLPKRN